MTGKTLGKYEIRGRLGRGSFAEVLLAWHPVLEAPRALKVPYDQSPERTSRLAAEARTQAQLVHPHICQVYDTDQAEGTFFIVMEYAAGGSLRRALGKGPVELDMALGWFFQTAEALSFAHRRGVVHRDLKPDNLLLSDEGSLKVADYGLARVLRPAEEARTRAGTFQYMAPEQMKGQATFLSDLWSLGVVFYEVLSGRAPFRAESQWALASRIMSADAEPLLKARADLPPPLAECLHRLLERDPARRTPSAEALLEELRGIEKLLGRTRPLAASPPPRQEGFSGASSRETIALYDWPQARGGPARQGSVSSELVMPLQLAWRSRVGASVVAPPVVSQGLVVVATTAGELVLLEEAWGAEVSRVELDGSFPAAPAVAGGLAYAAGYSARLYAVELTEAKPLWEAELGAPSVATPAATEEALFVPLMDGRLLRLSREGGALEASFQAGAALASPPLVVGEMVLVGSREGRLYALEVEGLSERWCFDAAGWIDAGASAAGEGLVVVGSHDGSVSALEAATGLKRWQEGFSSWVVSSPAVSGGAAYVAAFDGTAAALDLESGSIRWGVRMGGRHLGGPALAGEHLMVAGAEGLVVALDLADGSEVWSAPLEGECLGGPSVAGRSLYLADRDGHAYAFR